MISSIISLILCIYIISTCILWSLNVLFLANIPVIFILMACAKIIRMKCSTCQNTHHMYKYTYKRQSRNGCFGCKLDCPRKAHHVSACVPCKQPVRSEARKEIVREQIGIEIVDEPIYGDMKTEIVYYEKPVSKTRWEYKQTGTKQTIYSKYSTFDPVWEYVPVDYIDYERTHKIDIIGTERPIIGYKKVEKPVYNTYTKEIPSVSYDKHIYCECNRCSCSGCIPKIVDNTCFECTCEICTYVNKLSTNIHYQYPCHISCGIFPPMIHCIVIMLCMVSNILMYVNYDIHVAILIVSMITGIASMIIACLSIC